MNLEGLEMIAVLVVVVLFVKVLEQFGLLEANYDDGKRVAFRRLTANEERLGGGTARGGRRDERRSAPAVRDVRSVLHAPCLAVAAVSVSCVLTRAAAGRDRLINAAKAQALGHTLPAVRKLPAALPLYGPRLQLLRLFVMPLHF
ncbi:hypothetical protein SKAU_G00036660 [Synaphobranchus kaupii]|uniref:Uncharacterized protein n=1 Tax=Synaphobranchus kaupii TaxID=118154 RepID=A0A9Q1JEU2_SYNKA|nr:hypothetical protein SKAU_G00036660 [Synaphobranchus kaupii]